MAPLLYQHDDFYREILLQDSQESFVIVYDLVYCRHWPTFKTYNFLEFLITKI